MESTKNYAMFKKHPANRPLVQNAVERLVQSIKAKNLLEFRPILVNSNLEVIDGQHRIEAARRLGVAIYYDIEKSCTALDMLRLNNNQTSWIIENHIAFFISQGNENYIKLQNFMNKYGLKTRVCLKVLMSPNTKEFYMKFKNGEYKFPDDETMLGHIETVEKAREIIQYIKEKTQNLHSNIYTATFYMWLCVFLNHPRVEFDVFMNKLPFKLELIRPCSSGKEYLKIFTSIYNYKSRNPIEFHEYSDEQGE